MEGSVTFSYKDSKALASMLAGLMRHYAVLTLTGPLGVGKTTLVQSLLATYGVADGVISPTFTYVNVYHTLDLTIYHFDLYRLQSLEQFEQMGFIEYLYAPGSKAIIEWPALIMPLLDTQACHGTLAYTPQEEQRLLQWYTVNKYE